MEILNKIIIIQINNYQKYLFTFIHKYLFINITLNI